MSSLATIGSSCSLIPKITPPSAPPSSLPSQNTSPNSTSAASSWLVYLPTPSNHTEDGSTTSMRLLASSWASQSLATKTARSHLPMTCKLSPPRLSIIWLVYEWIPALKSYQAWSPRHHKCRLPWHCLHHPLRLRHRPQENYPPDPGLSCLYWAEYRWTTTCHWFSAGIW